MNKIEYVKANQELHELRQKIEHSISGLEPHERVTLGAMIGSKQHDFKNSYVNARAAIILDILFPSYDVLKTEESKPLRLWEKRWWWNGVNSDFDCGETVAHTFHVEVTSYVGNSENDTHEMYLPNEWFLMDDAKVKPTVEAFLKADWEQNTRATHEQKQRAARADLEKAKAAVARLEAALGE